MKIQLQPLENKTADYLILSIHKISHWPRTNILITGKSSASRLQYIYFPKTYYKNPIFVFFQSVRQSTALQLE